jgi:hypothetical protein
LNISKIIVKISTVYFARRLKAASIPWQLAVKAVWARAPDVLAGVPCILAA